MNDNDIPAFLVMYIPFTGIDDEKYQPRNNLSVHAFLWGKFVGSDILYRIIGIGISAYLIDRLCLLTIGEQIMDDKRVMFTSTYKELYLTVKKQAKRIKELENIIKMLKWEYKVDMSKEEMQSIVDGRNHDRNRIKELETLVKAKDELILLHAMGEAPPKELFARIKALSVRTPTEEDK